MDGQLTYGMVGGALDSMIGESHRNAILLDGRAKIVSGCFSRNFKKTLLTGQKWKIKRDRLYRDYQQMVIEESRRKPKIDFVVIATPNISHYEIAKAFLEKGINVACEKPLTTTLQEAEHLKKIANQLDLLVCVTYSYTAFPVIPIARKIIRSGEIGSIRMVNAQYLQGWLAKPLENENKQSNWRLDPSQSGLSNTTADIGSHVENMISYLIEKDIQSLCARLDTFVKPRKLEDNSIVMVNFKDGARGIYCMSQIAIGEKNNFNFSIYGSKGSLKWSYEHANTLNIIFEDSYKLIKKEDKILDGTNEGFKNLYSLFITDLINKKNGKKITNSNAHFQSINSGVRGMKFIEKCLESNKKGTWVKFN